MDVALDLFGFDVVGGKFDDILAVFSFALLFFSGFPVWSVYSGAAFISQDTGKRIVIFPEFPVIIHVTEDRTALLLRREGVRIALANAAGININKIRPSINNGIFTPCIYRGTIYRRVYHKTRMFMKKC